jgi:hypothetical protein
MPSSQGGVLHTLCLKPRSVTDCKPVIKTMKIKIFWDVTESSLVHFCQTTLSHIPEDSDLSSHHSENLKSHN